MELKNNSSFWGINDEGFFDMKKIAIICSELNKDLVENLYDQAFEKFVSAMKQFQKLSIPDQKKYPYFCSKNRTVSLEVEESARETADNVFGKQSPEFQIAKKALDHKMLQQVGLDWVKYTVPGAGEIPLATRWIIDQNKEAKKLDNLEAILSFAVIIRGETSHYKFLCNFLERSLWDLQKLSSFPIIFSVLMVENKKQAEERIKKGRGRDAVEALIKMMDLKHKLKSGSKSNKAEKLLGLLSK